MNTGDRRTNTAYEQSPTKGRWWLVAAALLLQFSIGAVYAWSVFSKALSAAEPFHLSKLEGALPFEVTIGMIFIGTYIGGRLQDKQGPRPVALIGGVIYAFGVILASFSHNHDQLWLLVLGYGVIGGFGLGFAYIVPIAMLQKWFPDKRGLITGLAVGGFGFGAVLTSPIAQRLIDSNKDVPTKAFLPLGIGVPHPVADRRVVLPQPAEWLPRPGLLAGNDRPRRRQRQGLHREGGAAHPAVVPAHRDPHPRSPRGPCSGRWWTVGGSVEAGPILVGRTGVGRWTAGSGNSGVSRQPGSSTPECGSCTAGPLHDRNLSHTRAGFSTESGTFIHTLRCRGLVGRRPGPGVAGQNRARGLLGHLRDRFPVAQPDRPCSDDALGRQRSPQRWSTSA